MRSGRIRGMVTGAIVGAATVGFLSMMDHRTKQRMCRCVTKSANRLMRTASGFFVK